MEQPAIPVTPYPLHIPGQHPPGPPGSLPSGLPQLPPLQQNTMQPSYPPQLVQQGSGSARVPPPLHQARLLLMQQQHQMTAGAGPLVQPQNANVQGGVSTQMHPRQSQPPQQPVCDFDIGNSYSCMLRTCRIQGSFPPECSSNSLPSPTSSTYGPTIQHPSDSTGAGSRAKYCGYNADITRDTRVSERCDEQDLAV